MTIHTTIHTKKAFRLLPYEEINSFVSEKNILYQDDMVIIEKYGSGIYIWSKAKSEKFFKNKPTVEEKLLYGNYNVIIKFDNKIGSNKTEYEYSIEKIVIDRYGNGKYDLLVDKNRQFSIQNELEFYKAIFKYFIEIESNYFKITCNDDILYERK